MLKVLESGFGPDLLQQGVLQLAVERTVFKSIASHDSLYKLSISKPGAFWQCAGAKQLKWVKQSQEVLRMNKKTGEFHWFEGAKLNVSVNCLDEQNLDNVALLWESDDQKTKEITYRKLLEMTCQIANVLKDKGMNKGDVIVIYMPTMPLAVAAMLACTRIGAVHCVVFSDFNARVLSQRIKEVEAKAIITADTRVICGKHRSLKERVEKALKLCPGLVEFVLMAKRSSTSQEEALKKVNELPCFSLEKEMAEASSSYEPETMDAEDFLFIAYTSGVQGTSKAVYHTQAGFLLYTKLTFQLMFNPGPGDKIGCVSDLGWLGAHCFVVYGPLSNGCTTLLFESTATFPNHGRYWEMVDKLKLTHFLTVPSVLKELMLKDKQSGLEIDKYELGTLKFIATAGEPIPSDVQNWYYTRIGKGKCFFLDIWGQTEIGGIGIVRWEAPEEKRRAYFPQSKSFPLFGVDLSLSTDEERTTKELFLKQPLPGMGKKLLVEGKANSFEQLHYENQQGEYSTNDLIEVMNGEMKVTGRKDRAVFTQGVWLSMPEIADQLRKDHAGTEICDAQVIACSESHGEDEQGGLCVVLLSSEIPKEKREKFTADTKKSIMSKFNSIIGSKIKVYFLKLVESIKQYLYTATMKTSSIALKQFLNSRQKQGDTSWEVIDETEFLTFCMNEKHLLCYADH